MTSTNDSKQTLKDRGPRRSEGQPPMSALRVVDTSLAQRRSERQGRDAELSLRLMLDVADALTEVCDKLAPGESLDVMLAGGAVKLTIEREGVALDRFDLGGPAWT